MKRFFLPLILFIFFLSQNVYACPCHDGRHLDHAWGVQRLKAA
jgi:hypothetical protein